MAGIISREIRLKRRPLGLPGEEDFELAEVRVPDLEKGQMLVQNVFMSVDPYMRGRMDDRESYITPFALGEPLEGGCVGRIVASRQGRFREGDYVAGMKGWREFFITDGSDIVRVDPQAAPVQAYLGVLGMPGLTAYVGLLDIGAPRKGETVFVSAAAGAVGSVACQIAKIKGCRVVGSAGSDEKVAWLREHAGIDAAFNYKSVENLAEELARQCPEGVDVAFENVGGPFLEASIQAMSPHGRIVLCGMISVYNATRPTRAPRNLVLAIPKRLTLKGFIVSDHLDRQPEFARDMAQWIQDGRIQWRETIVEGIENAPRAFLNLFSGESFGKMLVKLSSEPASPGSL